MNLPEQLNSKADELADTYTTVSKQFNILSTHVAICYDGKYVPNDN